MSPLIQTFANGSALGYRSRGIAGAATSFESIATVSVGSGGAANVEFTSIPSTYTHLQVRAIAKAAATANDAAYDLRLSFNGNTTGADYNEHYLFGNGSSVGAGVNTNNRIIGTSMGSGNANMFAVNLYDILDYANTNKYKTVRTLCGWDANGSGQVTFMSQVWMKTDAITSIKVDFNTGPSFGQYSHFALYGIRGA